MRVLDSGTCQ